MGSANCSQNKACSCELYQGHFKIFCQINNFFIQIMITPGKSMEICMFAFLNNGHSTFLLTYNRGDLRVYTIIIIFKIQIYIKKYALEK